MPTDERDIASPHAEIKRRRRRDPLANMKLTHHQQWAAEDIRKIYEAIIRSLTARVRPTDGVQVDTSKQPLHPLLMMPEKLFHLRQTRYLPWVTKNRDLVAQRGLDRLTKVDLVLWVIVDREPLGEIARRFGKHHKLMARSLRGALDTYCA